ncbi:right-handed parallel beta-helix repeat-containing protein, partial [Maribacter sp.]|nr:right-handed parallel beta-helix repeat-containing protein [Maribacter sp.]
EYGAILDGSGIQGTSEDATRAIRSLERGFICNLIVREYPTWNDPQYPNNPRGAALEAIQQGAILNCEVHSHNKAIAVNYGSKALWNKFTAGRIGIHSVGTYDPNDPNRRGTVVKYNEWFNCNFNNYAYGHEAGGSKFVQLDGTILSHNYIHDNPTGPGIWEDGDNRDSEIYNNVIINTDRSIFSEISHTSNIHHNTIEYGLGFGAIYMSNSQGEKVHHNFVRWCRNGITIRDKERGTSKVYPGQAWRGMNNEIYSNHIWQQTDPSIWTHGMATLFDGHIDPNNTTNQWHDNHYYIDDNAEGAALFSEDVPFAQVFMYIKFAPDTDHWSISWEEWKELSGDTNSSMEYRTFY